MDLMNSYFARKYQKRTEERKEKHLKPERTYIIKKYLKRSRIIFRPQDRHLRPYYVIAILRDISFEEKFHLIDYISKHYGEGNYVIMYNQKGIKGFQLYWKGMLPFNLKK